MKEWPTAERQNKLWRLKHTEAWVRRVGERNKIMIIKTESTIFKLEKNKTVRILNQEFTVNIFFCFCFSWRKLNRNFGKGQEISYAINCFEWTTISNEWEFLLRYETKNSQNQIHKTSQNSMGCFSRLLFLGHNMTSAFEHFTNYKDAARFVVRIFFYFDRVCLCFCFFRFVFTFSIWFQFDFRLFFMTVYASSFHYLIELQFTRCGQLNRKVYVEILPDEMRFWMD